MLVIFAMALLPKMPKPNRVDALTPYFPAIGVAPLFYRSILGVIVFNSVQASRHKQNQFP
jgi:hypothetical protein